MKRPLAVLIFLFSFLCSHSQKIQVILPRQAVIGDAFQIQYVISDPSALAEIIDPSFDGLRLISGPNYYKGNSLVNGTAQPIQNVTYTVMPLKTGTVRIHPLIARNKNGSETASGEVTITVMDQPKASFDAVSTYTDIHLYEPSSKTDLDRLIDANFFIKAEVDKRTCYLGEALTATFKLYSRLQSTSELIKAPALYGFSVMDMLDINEAHQAVEIIGGKVFNTSIVRKLQLYPAQTGTLVIDEMQLQNTIEFDDPATGKKIKVEKRLASRPVEILVKPLPGKHPDEYSDAVGKFYLEAHFQDSNIAANSPGRLTVILTGKGNFLQLGTPLIQWPKDWDVFDTVVVDAINKNAVPAQGNRKYQFNFVAAAAGLYTLPPVRFSFFDLAQRAFKELSTDSLRLEVTASPAGHTAGGKQKKQPSPVRTAWIYFLAALALTLVAALFWKRKSRKTSSPSRVNRTDFAQAYDHILAQPLSTMQFCLEIQKLLLRLEKEYDLSAAQKLELQSIRNDCQLLIYSHLDSEEKKEELHGRARTFFRQLQA